jgi:hypothetical protein
MMHPTNGCINDLSSSELMILADEMKTTVMPPQTGTMHPKHLNLTLPKNLIQLMGRIICSFLYGNKNYLL